MVSHQFKWSKSFKNLIIGVGIIRVISAKALITIVIGQLLLTMKSFLSQLISGFDSVEVFENLKNFSYLNQK